MIDRDEDGWDLGSLTVPRVGALVETGEVWEPWRLVDPAGDVVDPVAVWLRELQAAGRSVLTQRSYGMDLLRWYRFLWAIEVPLADWLDHATEATRADFVHHFADLRRPEKIAVFLAQMSERIGSLLDADRGQP